MENETIYEETTETNTSESIPEDIPEAFVDVSESSETSSSQDSETVSSDEVEITEEETETEEITETETFYGETVSSNSVSENSFTDEVSIYGETLVEIPFFDKTLSDYTVTEGLLLLIFILVFGLWLQNIIFRKGN